MYNAEFSNGISNTGEHNTCRLDHIMKAYASTTPYKSLISSHTFPCTQCRSLPACSVRNFTVPSTIHPPHIQGRLHPVGKAWGGCGTQQHHAVHIHHMPPRSACPCNKDALMSAPIFPEPSYFLRAFSADSSLNTAFSDHIFDPNNRLTYRIFVSYIILF